MATVVEHVRARAHRSTRTSPLPTPSLSRLVYVDFHALPGPRTPRGCLLREVAQASSIQSWYRYSLASHADRPLLETAGASGRFGGLRVRDAVTRIGASPLAQFGAVTFADETDDRFVLFRGTEASAVGWAEDARFGLDFPTDSQRWAANYLAYAASRADGPLTIVGHSKGANLAQYAAAVVEVFDPGGDSGVDLVAGGEGTPVVVLGCEGGPKGFGHGVIPAHSGLPHRHGSFHGAHVGGQFLGGDLCSPISMQHDPCGEAATGCGGHVECGDDQGACCAARPWRIPGLYVSVHRARWRTCPARRGSGCRRSCA